MEYVRQIIGSDELNSIFINLPSSLRNRSVEVIILPADNSDVTEKTTAKRQLGFVDCPPLPDSFFDPLPEEELQAWGL